MQTILVKTEAYPAVKASQLENGMIYFDGSEVTNVVVREKTTTFTLVQGALVVARTVRSKSLIALSWEQVAVVL